MTLGKNESRQVGTTFEAQVELSRTAEDIIPRPLGWNPSISVILNSCITIELMLNMQTKLTFNDIR